MLFDDRAVVANVTAAQRQRGRRRGLGVGVVREASSMSMWHRRSLTISNERMRKFELALHPDKTRLIRFGRQAVKQREKLGEGKPETFDFLGFTHFCTRSRKMGLVRHRAQDDEEAMPAKLLAIKIELRKKMHDPIAKTGGWMKQMLQGHLNYFAISGNHPSLWWFFNKVRWLWLAALKRRSQKARLSWEKFIRLVAVLSCRTAIFRIRSRAYRYRHFPNLTHSTLRHCARSASKTIGGLRPFPLRSPYVLWCRAMMPARRLSSAKRSKPLTSDLNNGRVMQDRTSTN